MPRGDVAVVGMAGRFPGAADVGEFWRNLRDGVESVAFFSEEELRAAGVSGGPGYVPAGARVEGVDLFDAEFFGYPPREAEVMDPQHRLFLEVAWEAVEDAGYDPDRYPGTVGVFAGAGSNGYQFHVYSDPQVVETVGRTQILLGNELGFLATRVSYKLNLTGPSVSLRTTCSTSLVAVHLAAQSLLNFECDMALAGAAFVNTEQDKGYRYQEGGILSPDGHCRPFDADAAGTVFGSGVGAVVLKRLPDALADRDHIHAVIKGSAVNNDGAVKVGFTAPAVAGQVAVIRQALHRAGVPAESIGYVEAHGTGTPMGDPIEVQALVRAFGGGGGGVVCGLGSVKSNVGHLDAAAGMAGLVKVVLALRHGVLPATVHFRAANPQIDFAGRFVVRGESVGWPRGAVPRRAGLSAFGFGGTNAHVVVQEPPVAAAGVAGRDSQVLVLSARSAWALDRVSDRLADWLRRESVSLADVAFTLATGRREFGWRRAVVAADRVAAAQVLERRDPGWVLDGRAGSAVPVVGFLFPGQGTQYPGMGRGLYEQEPVFRRVVDECAGLLGDRAGWQVRQLLLPAEGEWESAGQRLRDTAVAQPVLFILEYALVALWRSWGVTPRVLLGHSVGELVAATTAAVFTLPDALGLVTLRGHLMHQQPGGAMLAVSADRAQVTGMLPPGVALAAHNGPQDCVVSGPAAQIDALARQFHEQGITTRPVVTSHAFHSEMMDPVVDEFAAAVARVPRRVPEIPFVSNVTGTWITHEQAQDPAYWGRQLRATVEFDAGLRTLTADRPGLALIEVGPGQVLTTLTRRTPNPPTLVTHTLPHPQDPRDALQTAQRALGQLWLTGYRPDWAGYHQHEQPHRTPLPTYPFERQRYWLEPRDTVTVLTGDAVSGRRSDVSEWFSVPSWEQAPPPVPSPPDPSPAAERWLLFADRCGVAAALAQRLRARGATVAIVEAADHWAEPGDGVYRVDPADPGHYRQLLAALAGNDLPDRIVHCWNLTPDDPPGDAWQQVADAQRLGFDSLVYLAQALNESADQAARRMWVLSNGLHDVIDQERLVPAKALLLGPCRVIPREYPGLRCASVDLVLRPGRDGPGIDDRQIDALLGEFAAEPAGEPVAYRGRHRFVQRYADRPLPAVPAGAGLRPGGVYLITGGLGGLGLAVAHRLAGTGAKLILTARTPLPPPEQWDRWLAEHPEPGHTGDLLRRLRALEKQGAQVLVVQADVTDRERMRWAVEEGVRRWDTITGVFHAAGVAGGGLVQLKSREAAAEVLRPKVQGTLVLEEVLADQSPDFVVLFGSNAANVGEFGQVDYCAANAFLDAYAHAHAGRGRVVSIDWGPWREIGMAVRTQMPVGLEEVRRQDVEARGMAPEEGLEALDRILYAPPTPQIIVSPVDLRTLFAHAFALAAGGGNLDERLASLRPTGTTHARPELQGGYTEPRTDTQRRMCEVWADLLGIDRVGIHDSFFDLGGNSLVAIQLIARVNKVLGSRVTVARLYETLTVNRLSAVVDDAAEQAPPDAISALDERREKVRQRREYQQQRRRARGR